MGMLGRDEQPLLDRGLRPLTLAKREHERASDRGAFMRRSLFGDGVVHHTNAIGEQEELGRLLAQRDVQQRLGNPRKQSREQRFDSRLLLRIRRSPSTRERFGNGSTRSKSLQQLARRLPESNMWI